MERETMTNGYANKRKIATLVCKDSVNKAWEAFVGALMNSFFFSESRNIIWYFGNWD